MRLRALLKTLPPHVAAGSALTTCLTVAAIVAATAVPGGQTKTSQNASAGAVPRTAWGQPDLQGVWNFSTLTPLERPAQFANKAVLTEKEAIDFAERLKDELDHDTPEGAERACKGTGNYNEFWYDRGSSVVETRRSSLIIDPADGKIPAMTPDGLKRQEMRLARRKSRGPSDSWEDRGLGERCMIGFNAGPPMMPSAYNNNFQLFQTPNTVVIMTEMVHEARIVPMDGRPTLASSIRQWQGSSRGRWEGDTLVVETTNFTDKTNFRGASDRMKLIERFRRVDADTLMYEFTIDDPTTFTKPWTAQVPMSKMSHPLYEYACHEGNYGLEQILAGARAEERAAEAARNKR
jgi:hypothetical protein